MDWQTRLRVPLGLLIAMVRTIIKQRPRLIDRMQYKRDCRPSSPGAKENLPTVEEHLHSDDGEDHAHQRSHATSRGRPRMRLRAGENMSTTAVTSQATAMAVPVCHNWSGRARRRS